MFPPKIDTSREPRPAHSFAILVVYSGLLIPCVPWRAASTLFRPLLQIPTRRSAPDKIACGDFSGERGTRRRMFTRTEGPRDRLVSAWAVGEGISW